MKNNEKTQDAAAKTADIEPMPLMAPAKPRAIADLRAERDRLCAIPDASAALVHVITPSFPRCSGKSWSALRDWCSAVKARMSAAKRRRS